MYSTNNILVLVLLVSLVTLPLSKDTEAEGASLLVFVFLRPL